MKHTRLLFALCWLVYFSTYVGRLNYSACLENMIMAEHFTKGQAGVIGTGFFIAYGGSQLISGFLGDKLPPWKMVLSGVAASSICNLLMPFMHDWKVMTMVWGVNGIVQAFIWSPMLRLLSGCNETEARVRFCTSLNSSVPIGTMAAYGISAVAIGTSGWRAAFWVAGGLLLIVSALWLFGMRKIGECGKSNTEFLRGTPLSINSHGRQDRERRIKSSSAHRLGAGGLLAAGVIFLMPALFIQGALKDGVTTWIPTYISETYGIKGSVAVGVTMFIPIFNLIGIYAASLVDLYILKNEIKTAAAFFGVCSSAFIILWCISGKNLPVAFFMLAVATTAMMAVNTMLIAVLPSYFGVYGCTSSVSGSLNSFVYAGGAVSTYGIGELSVRLGWQKTFLVWVAASVCACICCAAAVRRWKRYRKQMLTGENE